MPCETEQDNLLIADCDYAMKANYEFNRLCEEEWDESAITEAGDVRQSS
jgi:hypothetical protein